MNILVSQLLVRYMQRQGIETSFGEGDLQRALQEWDVKYNSSQE